jgi:hypothetical protein
MIKKGPWLHRCRRFYGLWMFWSFKKDNKKIECSCSPSSWPFVCWIACRCIEDAEPGFRMDTWIAVQAELWWRYSYRWPDYWLKGGKAQVCILIELCCWETLDASKQVSMHILACTAHQLKFGTDYEFRTDFDIRDKLAWWPSQMRGKHLDM